MTRTIVIIHPGSLGDVLLAVPAIRRLRTRFSQHNIILWTEGQVGQLLRECRLVDECLAWSSPMMTEFFSEVGPVSDRLRELLDRCDLAVVWARGVDGRVVKTLRGYGVRETIVISAFSPSLQASHQSDRFLETLGEPPEHPQIADLLDVPESAQILGRTGLERAGITKDQPYVVLHPGSGSPYKCVDPNRLTEVLGTTYAAGCTPIVVEGPADRLCVDRFLSMSQRPIPVIREIDLLTLAGMLDQTRLYLGHDSGVTHLAARLGTHVLALFGPTDPGRWAPRGSHVTILRGKACSCQSWATVAQCGTRPCLDISSSTLVATFKSILNRT